MSSEAQTHYLNAGFDLGLRPRAPRGGLSRLDLRVRELSVQGFLGATPGDAVLVLTEVPDEFLQHLDDCGVPVGRVLRSPEVDRSTRFRPFGWSDEAVELNALHDRPEDHPQPSVIRRVNSRSFAVELERELFPESAAAAVVEDVAALESILDRTSPTGEWVVKGEFGNAGLANRRLRAPRLSDADRRFVETQLTESGRVVVERWLQREEDWSVVFDVPFDPTAVRVHETTYTRDGALIGALLEGGEGQDFACFEELAVAAERVAKRLEAEGYFGPVCMDAFRWRDRGATGLRPLVDLNCRRSMSDGAYRLRQRIAPDRTFYYRFFNPRKIALPRELTAMLDALGDRRYARSKRRGILLASPPDHTKVAVIFVAESRREVLELESELRARFEG